jgi:hypothetical protein
MRYAQQPRYHGEHSTNDGIDTSIAVLKDWNLDLEPQTTYTE